MGGVMRPRPITQTDEPKIHLPYIHVNEETRISTDVF